VTLPTAPRFVERSAIRIAGKVPVTVGFFGRTVTLGLPKPPEVICQSITEGTLRIRFGRAAGFANPARAGTYAVKARIGSRAFAARLTIR